MTHSDEKAPLAGADTGNAYEYPPKLKSHHSRPAASPPVKVWIAFADGAREEWPRLISIHHTREGARLAAASQCIWISREPDHDCKRSRCEQHRYWRVEATEVAP